MHFRLEFCMDYRMWWGEKRRGLRAKKPGFLSSTRLVNWNKGPHLGASGSPYAGWRNWPWFLYCFPLQVLYAQTAPVWRGACLRLKYTCWGKDRISETENFFIVPDIPSSLLLPPSWWNLDAHIVRKLSFKKWMSLALWKSFLFFFPWSAES